MALGLVSLSTWKVFSMSMVKRDALSHVPPSRAEADIRAEQWAGLKQAVGELALG